MDIHSMHPRYGIGRERGRFTNIGKENKHVRNSYQERLDESLWGINTDVVTRNLVTPKRNGPLAYSAF